MQGGFPLNRNSRVGACSLIRLTTPRCLAPIPLKFLHPPVIFKNWVQQQIPHSTSLTFFPSFLNPSLHWRETEEWKRREEITKRKMETKGVVLIVHRLWFQPREFLINPVTSDCAGQISLKHEEFLVRVRPHAPLPSRADKYLLVLFQCLYMLSRLRWSCPPYKV